MVRNLLPLCYFVGVCCVMVLAVANPVYSQKTPPSITDGKNQPYSPAELLKIIEDDWELKIEADSPAEETRLMSTVLKHIIEAADLIISHPTAKDETVLKAVRNKMQALGVLARTGDENAAAQAIAMATQLSKSKRPLLAREGKLIVLSNQLREIPKMNQAQQSEFVQQLITLISAGEISEREAQIAQVTAQIFGQARHYQSAQKVLTQTATLLENSESDKLKKFVPEFLGTAKRFGLPGHPMKLTGKTIQGKDFELKNLKGKVVLVQFWASWCKYCLQEMPHTMKLYSTYHPDGFEVIGVNLDDSADRAQKIIKEIGLPWTQLFSDNEEELGMKNPNAVFYGVTKIPQSILIDRKGNVILLQARGKELERELERIFLNSK